MKRTGTKDGSGRAIREGDQVAPHPKHPLRWTVRQEDGEWVATLNNSNFPKIHTTYLYVGTWWIMKNEVDK